MPFERADVRLEPTAKRCVPAVPAPPVPALPARALPGRGGAPLLAAHALALQRSIGNRALSSRLLQRNGDGVDPHRGLTGEADLIQVYRDEVQASGGVFSAFCMLGWRVGQDQPIHFAWVDDDRAPSGSAYDAGANAVLISSRYKNARPQVVKLMRFELMNAKTRLGVDVTDPFALDQHNYQLEETWKGTNKAAPSGVQTDVLALLPQIVANPDVALPNRDLTITFYHATNMENYRDPDGASTTTISIVGLDPAKGGGAGGSKRWETMGAERKDVGWTTVTTSYDQALIYATSHTQWARGGGKDMYYAGGIVLSFTVTLGDFAAGVKNGGWRRDDSGDANNWQTRVPIPANRLTVLDELVVPKPELAVAPPPMTQPHAAVTSSSGGGTGQPKRRQYVTEY